MPATFARPNARLAWRLTAWVILILALGWIGGEIAYGTSECDQDAMWGECDLDGLLWVVGAAVGSGVALLLILGSEATLAHGRRGAHSGR
jgi:hypothetical protein